jgi:hypothetical protein
VHRPHRQRHGGHRPLCRHQHHALHRADVSCCLCSWRSAAMCALAL